MKVLDLFSGLGGFSEAFLLAGDEIKRIENNPLLNGVPFTDEMCVLELRDILTKFKDEGHWFHPVDVVLASPPCYEFSLAYSAPQGIASRSDEFEEYEPNMELVQATLDIIHLLKPKYWVIENVSGSQRHFAKLGLIPHQIHDAYIFYGKFPKFQPGSLPTKAQKDSWHGDPLRSNKRALIPFELSSALRKAIVDQKTLFCDYKNP